MFPPLHVEATLQRSRAASAVAAKFESHSLHQNNPFPSSHLTPPKGKIRRSPCYLSKQELNIVPHPQTRLRKTARRQLRQRRPFHRPHHPRGQSPLRSELPPARLHRLHLRRRPPRRTPGSRPSPRRPPLRLPAR